MQQLTPSTQSSGSELVGTLLIIQYHFSVFDLLFGNSPLHPSKTFSFLLGIAILVPLPFSQIPPPRPVRVKVPPC
ncbi:hypothetical protein XELAEV_18001846mg [Xenopus laevis]|nr:hypothetical protein XELAEV_18001846mg [Xenopus laevis]